MADIIHRIGIKSPISKVYAAISTVEGVAGWWTRDAVGARVDRLSPISRSITGIRADESVPKAGEEPTKAFSNVFRVDCSVAEHQPDTRPLADR